MQNISTGHGCIFSVATFRSNSFLKSEGTKRRKGGHGWAEWEAQWQWAPKGQGLRGPCRSTRASQVGQKSCCSTRDTYADALLTLLRSVACKLAVKLRPGPRTLPQEPIPLHCPADTKVLRRTGTVTCACSAASFDKEEGSVAARHGLRTAYRGLRNKEDETK